MNGGGSIRGLWRHFVLSLQLNVRNRQALAYGYVMPVLFLLAFGAIFRGDSPPLLPRMGQLLTITILGGACFGLPTALVGERERGIWQRYRLLPVRTGSLVVTALLARLVLVVSAVVLQIVLAYWIYGTPLPSNPGQVGVALVVVAVAFLGIGILITALAHDVPAVQALGQCVFLPMIMIGGVGVPLVALPDWAQRVSGFMPGRYAVDLIQRSFDEGEGFGGAGFSFAALGVIGLAAGAVGSRFFRWEPGGRPSLRSQVGALVALGVWSVVGVVATAGGHVRPIHAVAAHTEITDADIESITYDDLPGDNELVTRLSPPFGPDGAPARVQALQGWLKRWPSARTGDAGDEVWALLSVAAIADIGADLQEAEIGRMVFDELQSRYGHAQLRQLLAWVILRPAEGRVTTSAPELAFRRKPPEKMVRERCVMYAKKYLGRLAGRFAD